MIKSTRPAAKNACCIRSRSGALAAQVLAGLRTYCRAVRVLRQLPSRRYLGLPGGPPLSIEGLDGVAKFRKIERFGNEGRRPELISSIHARYVFAGGHDNRAD